MPLLFALLLLPLLAAASPAPVTVLTVDGPITPASAAYVAQGLKRAVDSTSSLIVLKMDTPGGLDTAMRDIIKGILASPIPVATFVVAERRAGGQRRNVHSLREPYRRHGPGHQSRRRDAGTDRADRARRAIPFRRRRGKRSRSPARRNPRRRRVRARSPKNRSTTRPRTCAVSPSCAGATPSGARRRCARRSASSADEARELRVIDYIAQDVPALLNQVQGSRVAVGATTVTLDTAGALLIAFDPDWRTRLLSVIASPSVALMLMMLGIYGLLFEFMSPGYVLPGVVGGISLLLALFAFQMLPVNYSGFALIILGMAFFVAELFVPASGALGVGGVIAFVIGAVILVDTDIAGYGVPLPLIIALAVISVLFVFIIVRMGVQARGRPVVSGAHTLVGDQGEVLADFTGEGWANIRGEIWQVRSASPLAQGERVRVTGIDGVALNVEPQSAEPKGGAS